MLEAVGEVFQLLATSASALLPQCLLRPKSKVKLVAKMLKAIHVQESKKAVVKSTHHALAPNFDASVDCGYRND